MKTICQILLTTSLLTAATTSTAADDAFDKEIKSRQGIMDALSINMTILGSMAKGKVPFDAAQAEIAANNVYQASLMNNAVLYPKGSDSQSLPGKTNALPAAWTEYAKTSVIHSDWVKTSEALAASAGKSLDALRTTIGPVGKTCKGCHEITKAD